MTLSLLKWFFIPARFESLHQKRVTIYDIAEKVGVSHTTVALALPKDVAVAGTAMDVPVDAGIDQHSAAIGRIAVETLVAQINLSIGVNPRTPTAF